MEDNVIKNSYKRHLLMLVIFMQCFLSLQTVFASALFCEVKQEAKQEVKQKLQTEHLVLSNINKLRQSVDSSKPFDCHSNYASTVNVDYHHSSSSTDFKSAEQVQCCDEEECWMNHVISSYPSHYQLQFFQQHILSSIVIDPRQMILPIVSSSFYRPPII